jgi:hypothetical protein
MANPYTELVEDTFVYETDWLEAVDVTAPSSVNLSHDAQEATAVGYVPWNTQRSCARHFLGFSYADSSAPYRLHREPPAAHPVYPWLYAETVSFTPFIPKSAGDDHPLGSPQVRSVFDEDLKVAYYETAVCTVRYRNFRCRFFDDADITTAADEWMRWAYLDLDPKVEALQVTGGLSQLTFAEGGGANQPTPGVTKFGAPLAALLSKTGFSMVWLDVPWEYLSTNDYVFHPAKILSRVGTVNSTPLLSGLFPAGTMLLQPPQFAEKRYPVASEDQTQLLRSITVRLNWEYFQPEKGVPASDHEGHNLMPWSGDGTTVGDGKFYNATREGTDGGRQLLRSTDHNTVFEHVFFA